MLGLNNERAFPALIRLTCGVAAAAAFMAASRPACAVVPMPTGFSVDISSSARVLDALDMKNDNEISATEYYAIKYDEACDNPLLRIRARNKPAIMVTNFANSAAPITSFTLQINNNEGYAFGTGDSGDVGFIDYVKNIALYTDPGVSITSSSVSADKKTLTVNFDGLTADKKAIFHVDLDTTDPNAFIYPDYRMVLFGAPQEGDGEMPTTPATVTALFTANSPAPNTNTRTFQLKQFTATPNFFETDVRPYHTMDKIEVDGGQIPEPTGVTLALAGVAAFAVRCRRGRKAA
jgi:hypothetical protein